MRIAVINRKGGVAKSITAGHLAYGLAKKGTVLVIDADMENQSLVLWKQLYPDLPFEVVSPAEMRDLDQKVGVIREVRAEAVARGDAYTVGLADRELASLEGWEHLVIDTPPFDAAAVRAALTLVDTVVVPVSPNMIEVGRVQPTQDLFDEERARRGSGDDLREFYLLTSVRPTNDAGAARAYLEGQGLPVMAAQVPLSVHVSRSYGAEPYMNGFRPGEGYGAVLAELMGE